MNIIRREREREEGRNNLVAEREVIIIASQIFDLTLSGGVLVNLHKDMEKRVSGDRQLACSTLRYPVCKEEPT